VWDRMRQIVPGNDRKCHTSGQTTSIGFPDVTPPPAAATVTVHGRRMVVLSQPDERPLEPGESVYEHRGPWVL